MTLTRINDSDVASLKISSLPSRPTAPTSFGGAGYSAKQMKEAFDRLPMFIVGKLNELIDAISAEGDEGIASSVPSGISEGHTLADLTSDIGSGAFSAYLNVLGLSLNETVTELRERISTLSSSVGESTEEVSSYLSRIEEAEAAVTQAISSLKTFEEELSSLSTLVAAHEGDMESFDGRFSEISESVTELGGLLTELEEKHKADVEELREASGSPSDLTIDCGSPADLV